MKTLVSRRNVLKSSMAAVAAIALPKSNELLGVDTVSNKNNSANAFLAKHGNNQSEWEYLWSMMKVQNWNSSFTAVDQILKNNNYFTKIKYSSNDKYKLEPAKELIDFVLSPQSGVSFDMVLFESNPQIFKALSPRERHIKSDLLYSNILSVSGAVNLFVQKTEDRFGPSAAYINKFQDIHGREMVPVNAKNDLLLQLNDLISGICYSIITSHHIKSEIKQELNDYFDSKTNLTQMSGQNQINFANTEIG
jgi:hypothetical protein